MSIFFAAALTISAQAQEFSISVPVGFLENAPIAASLEVEKSSPRFSFQGAEEAFASAKAPTAEEVVGHWVVVGEVTNPKLPASDSDGYWPDGKMQIPAWGPGFYQLHGNAEAVTDAFGKTALTWSHKLIGLETKKVYFSQGPLAATLSTGFHFDMQPTKDYCGRHIECRVVQATGLFLCRHQSTDARKECKKDMITGYDGFIKAK